MSEVKLNLTDTQYTISGTTYGSVADACIAALSAEPETISELEAALTRYQKPTGDMSPFGWFAKHPGIDAEPWDAGIVIIDLAARIVASESTYSKPGPKGDVRYHDGESATDIFIFYRLPDDWLFLESVDQYDRLREPRRLERLSTPPLDARPVLYGRPLIEFVVSQTWALNQESPATGGCDSSVAAEKTLAAHAGASALLGTPAAQTLVCGSTQTSFRPLENQAFDSSEQDDILRQQISQLHAQWLMTPRDDLRGQSPREVLLARQDFIDYDLHTRSMQWSLQGEGPPCLGTDSLAYRFAGFGTHEWVIYYDLVRQLFWNATKKGIGPIDHLNMEAEIARLEKLKTEWLEHPQEEYDGRIPALLIENERIRLPIAMRARDMVIDDDCPVCQMMADDAELGMEVGFWHLDGTHMDDEFPFSDLRTHEEWETRRREWDEFTEKFNREWEERQQLERIIGAETGRDPFDISESNLTLNADDLIETNKPGS